MLILRRTERSDQPEMMHGGITNGGAALAQVCSCVAEGQGRALAAGPLPSCSPCAARRRKLFGYQKRVAFRLKTRRVHVLFLLLTLCAARASCVSLWDMILQNVRMHTVLLPIAHVCPTNGPIA